MISWFRWMEWISTTCSSFVAVGSVVRNIKSVRIHIRIQAAIISKIYLMFELQQWLKKKSEFTLLLHNVSIELLSAYRFLSIEKRVWVLNSFLYAVLKKVTIHVINTIKLYEKLVGGFLSSLQKSQQKVRVAVSKTLKSEINNFTNMNDFTYIN